MNLGFIGTGNMSSAIIKGLSKNNSRKFDIFAYDISEHNLSNICGNGMVSKCCSNKEVAENSDFIFLCVKPNALEAVLKEIAVFLKSDAVLVSIAAGKTIGFIETALGKTYPVIRTMPNVNALVGESMTALCRNAAVIDERFEIVKEVFSSIGKTVVIDEKYFSIFVGLSGSAPAYVYLFVDSIARAGVKAGLDKKTSLEIAAQAVLGSAKTIIESGKHPWELIDMVCSPGGTTIEGISSLLDNGFESAVMKAVEAVINKDMRM